MIHFTPQPPTETSTPSLLASFWPSVSGTYTQFLTFNLPSGISFRRYVHLSSCNLLGSTCLAYPTLSSGSLYQIQLNINWPSHYAYHGERYCPPREVLYLKTQTVLSAFHRAKQPSHAIGTSIPLAVVHSPKGIPHDCSKGDLPQTVLSIKSSP